MTRLELEKTYGIHIADDSYWHPLRGLVKMYKYYSADGCEFSNGLRTLKEVAKDCQTYKTALLRIKQQASDRKRG